MVKRHCDFFNLSKRWVKLIGSKGIRNANVQQKALKIEIRDQVVMFLEEGYTTFSYRIKNNWSRINEVFLERQI